MDNDKLEYLRNGTNVSTLSLDATNCSAAALDQGTATYQAVRFFLTPSVQVTNPEPSDADFFSELHRAYAALPKNDRHELSIWDATLADGLDEE
jgi:hypothetical protein